MLVAGLCIKEFPTLVERARVMERTKKEVDDQNRQSQKARGSSRSKFGFVVKKRPYSRPPS